MLVRNSIYNLFGLGGPLLAAVFTIPYLIKVLGVDGFGLLTLIWAVVSYFGLFDFGLGRALTQQVTIAYSNNKAEDLPSIIGTAYFIMLILGVLAALIMALSADFLIGLIKNVPNESDAINAMYAMAVAMPFIILTSGFRGVLEAKHAFGIINLIRLPMGFFTFLGPAAVVWFFGPRLDLIAWALVVGRIIGCIVHAWYAVYVISEKHRSLIINRSWLRPLCINGGWLTVSNVISPLMGYADRFLIGALVSAAAVAYYATPNEIITKLWIIPGALTAVLFPTFAAQVSQKGGEAQILFRKALFWLFLVMLPIVLIFVLFADEILRIWISQEFAKNSSMVLRILAIGMLVNSLAHIPFTLIQSSGNARITALIHLCEFPFFVLLLWWLTIQYGVEGAALAWLLRMIVDTTLMFVFSLPILNLSIKYFFDFRFVFCFLILFFLVLILVDASIYLRAAILLFVVFSSVATLFFSIKNDLIKSK